MGLLGRLLFSSYSNDERRDILEEIGLFVSLDIFEIKLSDMFHEQA